MCLFWLLNAIAIHIGPKVVIPTPDDRTPLIDRMTFNQKVIFHCGTAAAIFTLGIIYYTEFSKHVLAL